MTSCFRTVRGSREPSHSAPTDLTSLATRPACWAFRDRTNPDRQEPTMTEYPHRDPTRRDELLTIEQVADLIRMPVATLRYWRVLDTGPRGFIIGRRLRYWRQDGLEWLDEQRESTRRGGACIIHTA